MSSLILPPLYLREKVRMGWRSPLNVSTLPCQMRPRILSTTGLLALVLACPRVSHGQAEELPPDTSEKLATPETVQTTPPLSAPSVAPTTPPDASSTVVARDHRWVLIPYFGFNLPMASTAKNYAAGFRLGGLAGWTLTPRFSVNGEVTLDFMDGETDASMLRPHEHYLDFVLSPLFHLRSGRIVFGPRLGWFTNNRSFSDSDSAGLREWEYENGSRAGYTGPLLEAHSGQGFLLGLNAGGFAPVGTLQIGLLASASIRHFTTVDCGPYGCAADYSLVMVMSLALAAQF